MTDTLVGVSPLRKAANKTITSEEVERGAVRELVRAARARGEELTGPDGLLKVITKQVIEAALEEEMTEHVGYDKHAVEGRNHGNSRNGTRTKTVLTDNAGKVDIEVPRDRDGTFEPVIVKKRQRRLSDVDAVVISLYSVGFPINDKLRDAIDLVPKKVWTSAIDADGGIREGGDVAELTGLIDPAVLSTWPQEMRVIVRRERPHPGAQLSLFEERDGWRYQAFVTNTQAGQLAFLEARHRAHARVEDRIRHAKDTGLGRFPSREFHINQTWLTLTMIAADLLAWTRLLGCSGDAKVLASCEPKALRYRFLHVPARLTHGARRRRLRIPESWPWAAAIVAVFANIAAIPQPA